MGDVLTTEFQIRKDNFEQFRIAEAAPADREPALRDGAIRAQIERFAFTSNNITYAVAGDQLGYWQFFPPTVGNPDGWGMMPVWGFANVIESGADALPVGERLFGYFPPATRLDIVPAHVTAQRLVDGALHRARLPAGYNTYYRVNAEPGYDRGSDNERMLLWPLYITSFCLWDALQDSDWCGAEQIVIVSASSKTSIGLAYALDEDDAAPATIAVTSTRNLDFVNKLGLYEQSVTYEALDALDAAIPTVIVDMSGNGEILGRLHTHFGDNMKRCINVGLTHWDDANRGSGINAERSEFFFAPAHIQKRMQDWGANEFTDRSSGFIQETALKSRGWLKLATIDGLRGLAEIYGDVCRGRLAADQGLIVEL